MLLLSYSGMHAYIRLDASPPRIEHYRTATGEGYYIIGISYRMVISDTCGDTCWSMGSIPNVCKSNQWAGMALHMSHWAFLPSTTLQHQLCQFLSSPASPSSYPALVGAEPPSKCLDVLCPANSHLLKDCQLFMWILDSPWQINCPLTMPLQDQLSSSWSSLFVWYAIPPPKPLE